LVNPQSGLFMEAITGLARQAAQNKGVPLHVERAGSVGEIEAAFTSLAQLRPGALVVGINPFFASQRAQIAALAVRYNQMGVFAGKILNGAKPADLPVQQPTKFELVINLKTAQVLGLTVPPSLLARADEVIE
jgi:putative ABC transport system substrate-binding protein